MNFTDAIDLITDIEMSHPLQDYVSFSLEVEDLVKRAKKSYNEACDNDDENDMWASGMLYSSELDKIKKRFRDYKLDRKQLTRQKNRSRFNGNNDMIRKILSDARDMQYLTDSLKIIHESPDLTLKEDIQRFKDFLGSREIKIKPSDEGETE